VSAQPGSIIDSPAVSTEPRPIKADRVNTAIAGLPYSESKSSLRRPLLSAHRRQPARAGFEAVTASHQRPTLLTVPETADLLRTTIKAIYASIERGQLPGVVRIGRRVLINEQILVDWLRRNTAPLLERSEQ
jgi:excisionase family DNA binding protein